MRDHLALFHHQLLFVNVGAGAYPAHDLTPRIADRQRAPQRPAILAAMMAQPIFDFIGHAGRQALAPFFPGERLVIGMEHAVPRLPIGRADRDTGIFVPARVIIIMIAVGQRRPDHLRHGVGQGPEHAVAVGHGGGVEPLLDDHVAVAPAPFQFHHHLAREQGQPLPLQRREIGARCGVDDAQGAQRLAIAADQRRAGIEADVRRAGDQRIVGEPRVAGRVGDHEQRLPQHRQRAEGDVARRFFGIEADAGEEALAHILDNADERDRRVAQGRRKSGDVVQGAKAAGVEIVERQQRRSIRRQPAPVSHRRRVRCRRRRRRAFLPAVHSRGRDDRRD